MGWENLTGGGGAGTNPNQLHRVIRPQSRIVEQTLTLTVTDYVLTPEQEVPHEFVNPDFTLPETAKLIKPQGRWLFPNETYNVHKASESLFIINYLFEKMLVGVKVSTGYALYKTDILDNAEFLNFVTYDPPLDLTLSYGQARHIYLVDDGFYYNNDGSLKMFDLTPAFDIPEPQISDTFWEDGLQKVSEAKNHPVWFADGTYYYHEDNNYVN